MDTDTKDEPAPASPKVEEKKTKVVKVKKLQETVEDTIQLSPDDARAAFKLLAGKDKTEIDKATFLRHARTLMKVVKTTAMTEGMCIKSSKTTRRLDVNDVVTVLEGPTWCEESWVLRIHAKIQDSEGFVTVSGNQGSVFLRAGGSHYKVLKATELTDEFEQEKKDESTGDAAEEKAEEGEDKEKEEGEEKEKTDGDEAATKKAEAAKKAEKKAAAMLRIGDSLEVHELPRKGSTGTFRLKGKVKRTGAVGWATVKGDGTSFLEPI